MTTLTITPDVGRKRLKFSGTVASGEKVAVTVRGFGTAPVANLRLRVAYGGCWTVGMFPLEAEDEWSVSGEDLACTLNLATEQAERLCQCGADVCVMLEDTGTPQLYGASYLSLLPWVKLAGVDVPVNLENYKLRFSGLEATLNRHVERNDNPHGVTKDQIGLGSVDNTSDRNKPVSDAQNAAIARLRTEMTEADDALLMRIGEKYTRPSGGIARPDLAPDVQSSLAKADAVALKVGKSAFDSLLGMSLSDTATQKEVRIMVQAILGALKSAAVCAALALAAPAFGIDADAAWEDVPPTNAVKGVVEQFESDPAFRAWTNGSQVALGRDVKAAQARSVAVGREASATRAYSVALGAGASATNVEYGVAVGPFALSAGYSAAVGAGAHASHSAFAAGHLAEASAYRSVAIGREAEATDARSAAVGPGARSHGEGTFSVHATNPAAFFLGDASLQSFLDEGAEEARAEADAAYETKAHAAASWYPKDEGELWAAWWSGDGFRVTVTNYDVAPGPGVAWARLPSARFEYRPDGTNALRTVWDEETKWARWREAFAACTNALSAALDLKAGLDWGRTTPTGFDAPEGFTWLDAPATVVAGGLAWQKTLTSEGAFWVLSSNGMVAQLGADGASTNGYFRVTDERGESVFEVRAGDRVTVGAQAESVFPWTAEDGRTHLRVVYDVQSAEPPALHAARRLVPGGRTQWTALGAEGCPALAQGWTGASGAWTNAVWLAEAPAEGEKDCLFVYATYETGGDAMVVNRAAVSMEKLVLGGKTWTLGTATVDGHTVLTLTEAAR